MPDVPQVINSGTGFVLCRLIMLLRPKHIAVPFICTFLLFQFTLRAQTDSARNTLDTLLSKQKGVLGKLAQSLLADTVETPKRLDIPFQKYKNRVIRTISIKPLEFGVFIGDTSRRFNNIITGLANHLHHNTRTFVIRNSLFFKEGDRLSPFEIGNNERYLRDLPFLQEAAIVVKPVRKHPDSVDVIVVVHDVLSLGGNIGVQNAGSARLGIKEDNFMGWGDRLEVQTLYDKDRSQRFGFGAEYLKRNIFGSFVDASAGYLNFNNAFSSQKREEKLAYIKFIKPFLNPKMRWTYAASAELHQTSNMFSPDSVYKNLLQYKYRTFDAWAGYNPGARRITPDKGYQQVQVLLGSRVIDQRFLSKPNQYVNTYNYAFSNLFALLGAASFFKLNYYKTKFIYGFGRNEDIPEGTEATVTVGYSIKNQRTRPYTGILLKRYFLTPQDRYFDFTLGLGTSFYRKEAEDVNLLFSMNYFGKLRQLSARWKQRNFFSASFARQLNARLDEPLLMESEYGLPSFENNHLPGKLRATIKAESVFFSPWSLVFFKFAPFVFGSVSLFEYAQAPASKTRIFTGLGGGVRTRNESLIFGTIELRGAWFPGKDALNNGFALQISTNLRFKYNQNFIRRPDFVSIN